jgi:predicted secreted Zn-dependent protease
MNARFSPLQVATIAILLLCFCCELGGIGIFAASLFLNDSSPVAFIEPSPNPTVTRPATAQPTFTATPAPTYTRVVEPNPGMNLPTIVIPLRTPTRVTNLYQVVVPTPTAPAMTYPIAFTSTFKVITYTVIGKTVNDISKSLEANAIADPHEPGSRYYALTRWQLAGNSSVTPSLRGCEVNSGDVSVTITMTLPALATTTGVPADALNRFNTFMEKTVLHESGHAELALQGARDYQRALGNFPPVSDCEGLKIQLNNLFRRSFDTMDAANSDYDAKTQHGVTQGAVFP